MISLKIKLKFYSPKGNYILFWRRKSYCFHCNHHKISVKNVSDVQSSFHLSVKEQVVTHFIQLYGKIFQVSHGVLVSFMHKDCLDELKLSNFLEAIYLCIYSCAYLCIKHVLITYYTPGVKDL